MSVEPFIEFLSLLREPIEFDFMRQALLMSFLVCLPMSLLSCFLILKGWSLLGAAIPHAAFPGMVLANALGFPVKIGGFISGFVCILLSSYLERNSRIKSDTNLGLVFASMFGLGIVLYHKLKGSHYLEHILYGNLLGIDGMDLIQASLISIIVTLIILIKHRDFTLQAFDEMHAHAIGLNVTFLHYGLMILVSLAIMNALESSGLVLTIAMLIAPGVIAFLATNYFPMMLFIACFVGTGSGLIGTYLSFYVDSAPAPTIVMVMTAVFLVLYSWSGIKRYSSRKKEDSDKYRHQENRH